MSSEHAHDCCSNSKLISLSVGLVILTMIWSTASYWAKTVIKLRRALMAKYILVGLMKTYNEAMGSHKVRLFAGLQEMAVNKAKKDEPLVVVEIGSGSGANFKYFPSGTRVTCIEPNDCCEKYLRDNAKQAEQIDVAEFNVGRAEDMGHIASESVDAVVCTLVLCSVEDIDQCLREIRRILKPAGKFFFLEHIIAEPNSWDLTFQRLFNGIRFFISECNYIQPTHTHIENAGFAQVQMNIFHAIELQQTKSLLWRLAFLFVTRHAVGYAIK